MTEIAIDRRRMLQAGAAGLAASAFGMPTILRAQVQRPVKVGVLGDFSTAYASVGGPALLEAVKMAAEEVGPVLGMPVEIVSADT
ncbi:MAG: transporter permease, partial [Enterovirga sp.]|nr:transporter permease [Enterovirga sp.]